MTTPGDEARSQLLEEAVEAAHRPDVPIEQLRAFVHRYFRHVADEDLVAREPVDLAGIALSHVQAAAHRADGTAAVRVFTPTVDEHGWATGHTVVEIVTDDMPFLVDSVSAELTRQNRAIHLVIHPTFVVRRTVTGDLLDVLDASPSAVPTGRRHPDWPDDARVESWIHVEIDRETHPDQLEQLSAALESVLSDVRAAVEDWPKMRQTALDLADELEHQVPEDLAAEGAEAARLLRWLVDENFTFLGYREYRLGTDDEGEDVLTAVPGTGRGILRYDQRHASDSFGRLPARARAKARERHVLVLTKANSRATVHRPSYLDYVGVKSFGPDGSVAGERRFLGLFTSQAYVESVRRVPVIDAKLEAVLQRAGFAPDSHSGKDVLTILETYPRDELFQISVDDLYDTVMAVLQLQERRRTRLFLRRDAYGRFMSAMVFLPRDRYTTEVRLRMEQILREAFDAVTVDYTTRVSESVLARLHYVLRVRPGQEIPDVDVAALERQLVEATRTWEEDLADALRAEVGEEEAARLTRTWGGAFPEAYKEDFSARVAVSDIRRIERLERLGEQTDARGEPAAAGTVATNLYEPVGAAPTERRFKLFRWEPLSLTTVLPFFRNLGVEVVDERPYELERSDGRLAYVYDFGLRFPSRVAPDAAREMFTDAFAAAWDGRTESDGLDALVLLGGLTWRQVVVLRAYAKYLRQTGSTFSQDYVEQCLLANVPITRSLVRLFEARFQPREPEIPPPAREETQAALVEEIQGALDDVASLDHDRILRSFLGAITATMRTSFYQVEDDGQPKQHVAFKLDPRKVPDLPEPRPAHEVWVYAPHVEGVHLRFGAVARGGLRWSDRREDFRTEVLGLVKAQMVKNAVIVPTGAKGGFVGKQLPDPAEDRDAWLAEGVRCYTTFIRGLLDVTDNLVIDPDKGRQVVPPPRVVRHDEDDTYLVVAADKGTASFSDIANSVSQAYGFWLGDAFASGGSVGYDHKAMGITARGAWESVKRHFREMGTDIQSEDFTVVGIGDMSGDVFGNGMLLSEHIRLVAAFDHRHVFLDPDPDPATSYAERRRLFDRPRSSWADYDRSLISKGGGVYPRTAKSIPVSPQVRAALGLGDDVRALTPNAMLKAVLTAPVDLLWNGGIGTYVKASTETHADVGDKANDAIRVDGTDLRAKVVGEGGNLGLTQRGRIEAALSGVRINTDAIDNSAGVDTSDHEVNIKILLDAIVAAGDLTGKQRNQLLLEMTDEVAALVLRDNYEQNVLLGNARRQAREMLPVHQRFIKSLEASGDLDRSLEFLPSDAEIAERIEQRIGLTSPEFSVLVAYAKITLGKALLATDLPDDPWFQRVLRDYFPRRLVERYDDRLASHPLRREIVTTGLVNEIVNRGGITFAFRAMEETGAAADHVVRAYAVGREIFGLREYVQAVEALDAKVATDVQTTLYLQFRRLLDRSTRWFLQNLRESFDVAAEIERFGAVVGRWRGRMGELLCGGECERFTEQVQRMVSLGVPQELAVRHAGLLDEFALLDVAETATTEDTDPDEVARVYFTLSERYGADVMLRRIAELDRQNRWEALARGALRDDLYAALEALTRAVLAQTDGGDPLERVQAWEAGNAGQLARVRQTIDDVQRLDRSDLASLSVALRLLRGVIRSGSS
ncbi:NAD-glutamate dehydrogenase [Quadrisphaera sp. GCM10027208]|uniref:NAD-glutamate dehydrogenase n=1 Tax=Quadrisphaera sp. GCM10027208 TaxID=3273423 RepID=UPI00361BC5DD